MKKRKPGAIVPSKPEKVGSAVAGAVIGGIIAGPVGAVAGAAVATLLEKGPSSKKTDDGRSAKSAAGTTGKKKPVAGKKPTPLKSLTTRPGQAKASSVRKKAQPATRRKASQ